VPALRGAVTPQQIATEETKVLKVEESIRVFVRVADPKFRQIVPMRFFNLALTAEEADICCAEYLGEKSLRADVARVVLRLVALTARTTTEIEELKRCENSPSLWKLHADSLIVLLEIGRSVREQAARMQTAAPEDAAATVAASLQKLQECAELALKALGPSPRAIGAGTTQ
jgi:hypothetical protein